MPRVGGTLPPGNHWQLCAIDVGRLMSGRVLDVGPRALDAGPRALDVGARALDAGPILQLL